MKQQLNEIRRIQQLAGLIKENEIPTIVKVEKQTMPIALGMGKDLILTLSNGKIVNISSDRLNDIYGNKVDNPEDVVGELWDQPPYVDEL